MIPTLTWTLEHARLAREVGQKVAMVMRGDETVAHLEQRLRGLRDQAVRIVESIDQQLEQVPA